MCDLETRVYPLSRAARLGAGPCRQCRPIYVGINNNRSTDNMKVRPYTVYSPPPLHTNGHYVTQLSEIIKQSVGYVKSYPTNYYNVGYLGLKRYRPTLGAQ